MIELIFIIGLLGIGVFLVLFAAETLLNNVLSTIIGLFGIGVVIYALIWALRWFILGGLLQ